MKKVAVDCVLDCRASVGESAIWSVREQALYFADIPAGVLWRFDPSTSATRTWEMGQALGCFALRPSGAVVALEDGFFLLDFESDARTPIGGVTAGVGQRFNDGTVDPRGRFYAGTMPMAGSGDGSAQGVLMRLDADHKVHEVERGYYTVNGLVFSADGGTVYVSDSNPSVCTVWAYDYDVDTAAWSNKRVFFDTNGRAGRPDGGAIDSDGCYWMAGVGGWELVRVTPDGNVDMEIAMPVEKPTKIAFGGANLDVLYVTSIGASAITEGTLEQQPQAGSLFALTVPGVHGIPFPEFAG